MALSDAISDFLPTPKPSHCALRNQPGKPSPSSTLFWTLLSFCRVCHDLCGSPWKTFLPKLHCFLPIGVQGGVGVLWLLSHLLGRKKSPSADLVVRPCRSFIIRPCGPLPLHLIPKDFTSWLTVTFPILLSPSVNPISIKHPSLFATVPELIYSLSIIFDSLSISSLIPKNQYPFWWSYPWMFLPISWALIFLLPSSQINRCLYSLISSIMH